MIDCKAVRVRRMSYALGASMAAVAAASANSAMAQCAPDPTVQGSTTTCTGADADGLRITTDGSTVQVAGGARVTGQGGAAITVDIAPVPGIYDARDVVFMVAGTIDGGNRAGIAVLSGSVPANTFDFYGTQASVTVEANATVTGANAITAGPSAGTDYAPVLISLTNAGTITGTSGTALLATDPARGGFDVINNFQGGTIGAIVGTIGELNNAGVIDGGSLSAIDQTTTYNSRPYPTGWTNTGTIRSTSGAATVANLSTVFNPLVNSGTIANAGTGVALQGAGLNIRNEAGGIISAAGGTAITATALTLTNAGTISGDVVTQPAFGNSSYSVIDSTRGTINGNVSLGSGNDLVYGRYDGTATLATGITGTLDAGVGTNSMVLAPDTDLTVSTAITLPTGFQRLRLAPGEGATLTLAQGFVAPATIELEGYGSVINQAAITMQGQAFLNPYYVTGSPSLTNTGTIDATVPQGYYTYAVDMGSGTLNNSGTITSSGNGVTTDGDLANSGSIVAVGTALYTFNGQIDNSGTVRSTQGVGLDLNGNTYETATNSGTIEGATYGALTGYVLNNSGTIATTTTSGTAVGLENYGVLNNLESGVIEGGAWAITGHDPYGSISTYNAAVYNAGTINGDVTFVSPRDYAGFSNHNTFVALTGGVLKGNLTLGYGDTLVTDLVNTGTSQFAGIEGTVTTSGGLLRYRVSGDTSAVVGAVGPFATTGYELLGGAHLALTADTVQTLPLVLAGTGTVDLTADIITTNQNAVTVVPAVLAPGSEQDSSQTLTIVNHGTLSGTIDDYFANALGVVSAGTYNTLQNEGTIKAIDVATNGGTSFNAAVAWTGTLVNNGRIELVNSYATYDVGTVVNTGTIVQVDSQTGSTASYGIYDAGRVTNSGTIVTAGQAIWGGGSTTVVNSGAIVSTDATAITSAALITNQIGGTIRGNGTAIAAEGGAVVNAGAIVGDVNLAYWYGYGSTYYANGGTLIGNLTLGSGNDLFLQSGDATGVSGTIDAGEGTDTYGVALNSSGTVAVGAGPAVGFEDAMVVAFGTGTVATVTAVDASFIDFHAAGDGTVVNQAALVGRAILGAGNYTAQASVVGETLGSFVNEGAITGGLSGEVTRLVNSGTIGSAGLQDSAVEVFNRGALSFDNGGLITRGAQGQGYAVALAAVDIIGAKNEGTIQGSLAAYINFSTEGNRGTLSLANSGTISGAVDLLAEGGQTSLGGDILVDNAGTLAGGTSDAYGLGLALDGSGSAIDYVLNNSGAITGTNGVLINATGLVAGTIFNTATGTITASGSDAAALDVQGAALALDNAGRIEADGADSLAIRAAGSQGGTVRNTGTIAGSTVLGAGDDIVANAGTMGSISLGAGNDTFRIAGGIVTGTLDGGEGNDTIEVSGNATFASISNVEALRMSAGLATVSGTASLGTIVLAGGRLTGLAGSTISGSTITVAQGAIFGSAGTVNGNVAVAGTLSPGASPGTMTVNGNVALAGTSVSVFEITPTVSDKLVVNGQLAIAQGATLQIVAGTAVTPGKSLELITASGGISGSFATVVKPASLFGFLMQDADSITLVGQFLNDASYAAPVRGAIDYVNAVLVSGNASDALLAAVPGLVTSSGTSDAAAFALLTPEAYAAAGQIAVEQGLELAATGRSDAFASHREAPGAFTFGSALGSTRTLETGANGTARTRTTGYGFLGGLGLGSVDWSLGAFVGYLDSRQTLFGRGARTDLDGVVAGVHGRWTGGRLGIKATLAYSGGEATTRRALPGDGTARSHYDLTGWTADASVDYAVPLSANWTVRPGFGVTAIRVTRDGVAEEGGSAYALTVARERDHAVFVDGALTFQGGQREGARLRPYLSLGVRYQVDGRTPYALAALGGGGYGLEAAGPSRAPVLATATLGADFAVSSKLTVFGALNGEAGDADNRAGARVGARLAF